MCQDKALGDQAAERKAREIEGREAGMIGERECLVDEIVDLIATLDPARASMPAKIEGQDREVVLEPTDHATPGFQIGPDTVDADERLGSAAFDTIVERHVPDSMALRLGHDQRPAAVRLLPFS